jgi:hypothetical protein
MAKNDQNLKASEDFIRQVLAKNFRQSVPADALRAAAEKLCASVPGRATS